MTWSKFAKHTILHDGVESYCLVCDSRLKLNAIDNHVDNKEHKAKLASYPYLDKYPGDRIRKLDSGFFCEFCSIVLNTATKVTIHIETKHHLNNKGSLTLRRHNTEDVLVFDDVMIEENAWHAIHEGCCSVCAVEAIDDKHKQEQSHLLKLIQSKVEFVKNGLYRKLDDATFQCVTCNRVFNLKDLDDHFTSENHVKAYATCKINENKEIEVYDSNNNDVNDSDHKNAPEEVVPHSSDFSVVCDDIKNFTKDNSITYNAGISNAYCRVCKIRIPASLRNLKEHVSGSKHTKNVKIMKPVITKIATKIFIKHMIDVKNLMSHEVILNKTIVIDALSLLMMTETSGRLRCVICEVNVCEENIKQHTNSTKHVEVLNNVPVITSVNKGEFIREPRPGIFHCGLCNFLIPSLNEVEDHLQSSEHSFKKLLSNRRLHILLGEVTRHEKQKMDIFLWLMLHRFMRRQYDSDSD